jgi:ArsR family transcriptional regulator
MKAVTEMERNYKACAQVLKALADETRMEIVDMLCDGELCACKILDNFNITQPTLSYHMKILTECGLVEGRKDGLWMRYSLKKESFEAIKNLFDHFCVSVNQDQNSNCCKEQ